MNFSFLSSVTNIRPAVLLAQAQALILDEVGVVIAVLITLTGIVLQFYGARHRMSVEERVKDSKMTEDEARRQIRFYSYCAPIVTLIGATLLVVAILDMAR